MPHIVLVEPKIPPNTGNVARTCAATQTPLHLVGPLGFELSDRYLKRAGLDYWPHVQLRYHQDIPAFHQHHQTQGGRLLGFSVRGQHCYTDFPFQPDDWLVFGSETDGLPKDFLDRCDATLYIPMDQSHVRSLNLSVSVGIALFECRRQLAKGSP